MEEGEKEYSERRAVAFQDEVVGQEGQGGAELKGRNWVGRGIKLSGQCRGSKGFSRAG